MRPSGRRRWLSLSVETVLLGTLVCTAAIVFLPSCSRSRAQARCIEKVAEVRNSLEKAGVTDGPLSANGQPGLPLGQEAWLEGLPQLERVKPELASWESIGGCGVGGSGGGDVRWIGRRAPGGRIETECLMSFSAGEDLKTGKINFKASGDVPGRFNIGLQVPYLYSRRHDADYEALIGYSKALVVSSMGDLNLLVSRKFGTSLSPTIVLAPRALPPRNIPLSRATSKNQSHCPSSAGRSVLLCMNVMYSIYLLLCGPSRSLRLCVDSLPLCPPRLCGARISPH